MSVPGDMLEDIGELLDSVHTPAVEHSWQTKPVQVRAARAKTHNGKTVTRSAYTRMMSFVGPPPYSDIARFRAIGAPSAVGDMVGSYDIMGNRLYDATDKACKKLRSAVGPEVTTSIVNEAIDSAYDDFGGHAIDDTSATVLNDLPRERLIIRPSLAWVRSAPLRKKRLAAKKRAEAKAKREAEALAEAKRARRRELYALKKAAERAALQKAAKKKTPKKTKKLTKKTTKRARR